MKILEFDDTKFSKELIKQLEGRKFFAVSIVDGIYEFHVPTDMMKSHIIYACEMLKMLTLRGSIINDDDDEEEIM